MILDELGEYSRRVPGRQDELRRMAALAALGSRAFSRNHFSPGHFTASAWILDPHRNLVLLTHHRRLNLWLQLGGHPEGETELGDAALREASEESGLDAGQFRPGQEGIFDIDIHPIPPGKGEPAHSHFDVRYLLYTDSSLPLVVSDESHELAWVPLERVEDYSREPGILRMRDLSLQVSRSLNR